MIVDRVGAKEIEMEDLTMDIEEMEREETYMTLLMEELRELKLDEDILECIRNMRCEGNCDDKCQEDDTEECIRSIHCPGDCAEKCSMPGYINGSNNANHSEWHTGPGTVSWFFLSETESPNYPNLSRDDRLRYLVI